MTREFITTLGTFALDDAENPKLAAQFARGEEPQRQEVNAIAPLISKESIVLDVGAHIGMFTVPLASRAAQVYAFEPAPVNVKFLAENVKKNNLHNVVVYPFALGSVEGKTTLVQRGEGNTGSTTLEPSAEAGAIGVTVKTLDSLIEKADFIKMDVEGGEIDVLRGAGRILKESSPSIFFEVNMVELRRHATNPLAALRRVLEGYALYLPIRQGSAWCRVPNVWWPLLILSPKTFLFKNPGFVYSFNLLATKKNLASVSLWHVFSERT